MYNMCLCVCNLVNVIDLSSLLHDADYTLCLNAIGAGDHLYIHTSKPPKQGSAPFRILQVSWRTCWECVLTTAKFFAFFFQALNEVCVYLCKC